MSTTYHSFSKEFHKGLFEDFSRDFMRILVISLIFHVGIILFLVNSPILDQDTSREIQKMQDQYVNLMVQSKVFDKAWFAKNQATTESNDSRSVKREEDASQTTSRADQVAENATSREGSTTTGEANSANRVNSNYPRGRTREQISQEARKIGILGLITSGGGTNKAVDIDAILGESEKERNLGEVLSGLEGLRDREAAGGGQEGDKEIRGERTTEGGNINNLVEELGDAQSTHIARTGELVVDEISALHKEGEVTRHAGRNPDDVSAVINNHLSAIQYLYELQLRRNPNLRGKLVVRFTINPQGKITKVTVVSSTIDDEQLERYIVRRMQQWDDFGQVDPALGDAIFRQIFTFGF